jgi:hypothetical protein
MATEYEGQVLRPPGTKSTATVAPPEELLAAYSPPPLQKGGTVLTGVGVLRVGEPIKRSVDGKTWVVATYATATALNRTATDATSEAKLINVVLGGVINVNVAAIGAANAAALATSLGGTYYPGFGYIKF